MYIVLFNIIIFGITIALLALHGDVSHSDDHPLVKEMGLPL